MDLLRQSLALALLLALLAAAPVFSSVEGGPHDLISQGYDVVKTSPTQERCTRCHIASSSATQDFLPEISPVLASFYGASSQLCFSCHDGTTIVSPDVDASRTAFHPGSHGNDLSGYEGLRSETIDLPYLAGKHMECVTCHDPHGTGHRPFLRTDMQELCLVCHSKYTEFGRGKENRSGNHILGTDPAVSPRAEAPVNVSAPFRVAFPASYPLQQGKGSGGWHWDLGGHLSMGVTGVIGCTTCHAVHGDEETAPAQKLLTIEPVNDGANLFCEGCHAGTRGDGKATPPHPNPGGTTTGRTYHPVDDDTSNGTGRLLEIREPPGWPFGGGTPRRLLCTTCHTSHNALVQTSLLRTPSTAPGFCEECHEKVPLYHHPVGEVSDNGCAAKMPLPPSGTTRQLTCPSCHQAHNAGLRKASEADFIPLLSVSLRSGALCERCHPSTNPTCSVNPDYQATHFLGDSTLLDTYEDKAPPLRIELWPESGQISLYGGEKHQAITCLSCHSFRKGAVVSGDDGTARNLLAQSGNRVEWEAGQESIYLCTGCHSVTPGTGEIKGHSHPMMNADAAKLNRAVTPPASITPNQKVNCDSCHRPHEALTRGGGYILEAVDGVNTDPKAIHPQIDYTVTCHLCHDSGKF